MPQRVRKREQKTVEYNANNREREELSRGMVYRELYLRLHGQMTLTSAENTEANTERGDEWALVDEIKIIANNTEVIKAIRGPDLWWLNYFWYGALPPVSPELGDATTNPNFDTTLILPFWLPLGTRPIDTALDARELSDLKIEVNWNDETAVNSSVSSGTGFETDPQLEVASLESFNIEGPFAQWRINFIEKEITADNSSFQINLPVGPMFPFFALFPMDDDVDDGGIVNRFKWVSGTTVFADLSREIVRDTYRMRGDIQRPWGGSAYNDVRLGDDNDFDGPLFYDHVTDGFLSEAVDTLGFSEHNLELDVSNGSGTTKIRVYPHEIIPVRGQNNG